MKDASVVLGSCFVVAVFAGAHPLNGAHLHPRETPVATGREAFDLLTPRDGTMNVSGDVTPEDASTILRQVTFQREPIALMEVDPLGNVLIPVQADALVTHDGVGTPEVAGMDIRGTRCARSVEAIMNRTDGAFTVVCLPREYRLYNRMCGIESRPPEDGDP